MINHATNDSRLDSIFAAIANTASARLLMAFATLVKVPDSQTVQLPIVTNEGTVNEANVTVGQGMERMAIFKYIIETLGARLDRL